MEQHILSAKNNYQELDNYLHENNINNIFVVCPDIIKELRIYRYFESLENVKITYFEQFQPNPTYDSVCEGIKKLHECDSKFIIAVGGGSAMDVAKCIKLYANMNCHENYLQQEIIENDIQLLAVPTTAGTGSEATRFAVIYYNGEKQSINHLSCIPSIVLFDSSLLETLPVYQKKATALDALSHAIESMWSVNSNDESKAYSHQAMKEVIENLEGYVKEDETTYENMLNAANLAGKAINITQTTAGHAMCYKLTSLYGASHGHAAALVNSVLLPFMIKNLDKCIDSRGKEYLQNVFKDVSVTLGLSNVEELSNFFSSILDKLDLYNINVSRNDIDILVKSVNPTRLKNNPVGLSEEDIRSIYLNLFDEIEERKTK